MLESVSVSRGMSILLLMLTFCILVISREVAFVVAGTCISRLALLFSSAGSIIFWLALFLFICKEAGWRVADVEGRKCRGMSVEAAGR